MKLYIADYLADTTHLTRDEHGAYLLLLMALWRAGGKLPRDPAKLARITKCTAAEWEGIAPVVMEFFKVSGGSITQKRASKEIAKYQGVVKGSKSAGKASAAKRANKNNGQAPTDVEKRFNENPTNQNQNQNHSEEVAIATFVGSAKPMPTQPELIADEGPSPAKPRFTPTKAELDAIWEITPKLGRERSSRKDLERALVAAMRRGHDPSAVLAGLAAAYASATYSGDMAKGVHRLIEADRWQTFIEEPKRALPPAAWSGPWQLRAAVVDAAGEDVARGYVDPSVWRAEDRALVVRNSFMAGKLRQEVGPVLDRLKVKIVVSEGVAA
jgi:uncharacterized protein YdaU (DUF1376 family)